MKLEYDKTFDDYINAGEETVAELMAENGPLVRALRHFHDFYAKILWSEGGDLAPIVVTLTLNAFTTFLAGTRIAMTGHANVIFPTLRTALEYACYAFLIADDPSLGQVWIERHKDDAGRKASRAAFGQAVAVTATKLNTIQATSGDWIRAAYDAAIDFGGHPNPRGVFRHMQIADDQGDDFHRVNITSLYAFNHFETSRALIGCLDFGLIIAVVIARCRKTYTASVERGLWEMNELKEQVVADLNSATLAANLADRD